MDRPEAAVSGQLQPREGSAGPLSRAGLAWLLQADLPLASLSSASAQHGATLYRLDQRLGPIRLGIDQCGLFAAQGALGRFDCSLALDRGDLTAARIDLALDAGSVVLDGWRDLRWQPFAPWFDVAAHPAIRFRSSAVTLVGPDSFSLRGLLEIGGVTRLQTLDGVVTGRRPDAITATEVVELQVTTGLTCSAFGMPPGHTLLSDRVELRVRARIELET